MSIFFSRPAFGGTQTKMGGVYLTELRQCRATLLSSVILLAHIKYAFTELLFNVNAPQFSPHLTPQQTTGVLLL